MRSLRRPSVAASCLIALVLLGGLATYLMGTQASARDDIVEAFAQRASLAARLTSGALSSNVGSTRQFARSTFGGAPPTVQPAVDADAKADPQPRILVLDARGAVLGAYPRALRRRPGLADGSPALTAALGGRVMLSDLFATAAGPTFMQAVPFMAGDERRVWAGGFPASLVSEFAGAYLSSALGLEDGRAYLVDGGGRILATTGAEPAAAPLPGDLREALRDQATGTLGERFFASADVPESAWRVVFVAPKAALLAPIRSTRRAAWQLFVALAAAVLCLLALGATAVNRSARLAHERQHDALTGLANRALFLERTERALDAVQRRGGHLAALFVDLDRFKPINDTYGHAAGDALLVAVARRLEASVRSGDVVGRFGGDEFIVLCPDLEDPDEASRIAARIHDAVSRPYSIGDAEVTVGCSIGISVHSVRVEAIDAATLIGNADAAMYRAKQSGRGRVESFDPRLAAV